MRRWKSVIAGFMLLLSAFDPNDLVAQRLSVVNATQTGATLKVISVNEGLTNNFVRSVFQDSRGFLWIGTEDGLNLFDGHRFRHFRYDPTDSHSLSFNFVSSIIEDSKGFIWLGTYGGGVSRFDPATEEFTQFRHDPSDPGSLSDDNVNALLEDLKGTIWVATRGGGLNAFTQDTQTFRRAGVTGIIGDPMPVNTITSLALDVDGNIWAGTGYGVWKIDDRSSTLTHFLHRANSAGDLNWDRVNSLITSPMYPDKLFIGSRNGLSEINITTQEIRSIDWPANSAFSLDGSIVTVLCPDRKGTIWIGKDTGEMIGYSPLQQRFISIPQFAPTVLHDRYLINEIFEDQRGVIWIGTNGAGLVQYISGEQPFYQIRADRNDPIFISYPQIWSILEENEQFLWVSSRSGTSAVRGALDKIDLGTGTTRRWIHADESSSLPARHPGTIFRDSAGRLWLGTDGSGLVRLDEERSQFFSYHHDPLDSSSLSGSRVKSIIERKEEPGILWIGTEGSGINRFDVDRNHFARFQHNPDDGTSLANNDVSTLVQSLTNPDEIWVGTWQGGLDRLNVVTGRFTHFRNSPAVTNSLSSDAVISVHAYRRDPEILWIGTYDAGFSRFNTQTGKFRHYSTIHGLANNVVYAITEDSKGDLWLSTENGISRFDPDGEVFLNFDKSDGLLNSRFHGTASHFSMNSGRMYLGGVEGINFFYPDSIDTHVFAPTVSITGLRLSNRPVNIRSDDSPIRTHISFVNEINLDYSNRVITIEYSTLTYASPDKNRYRYRLEGFDNDWIEAGSRSEVTYTNLDPGTYTFWVVGATRNSQWSDPAATLRVVVYPPWWESTWFRLSSILLILASVIIGFRMRIQRAKAYHKELESEVADRTKEVAEKSAQLELQNRVLEEHYHKIEEQAEKLLELDAMKTRFFANISHEFRTPLTLIIGPLQDAIEGAFGTVDKRMHRQLSIMQRNAKRLQHLITQLLDLAKLEGGAMVLHKEEIDLVPLLKGLVYSFSSMAERKSIQLRFTSDSQHCKIHAEPGKIDNVFLNLLSNAFKFTPNGGRIEVSCSAGNVSHKNGSEIQFVSVIIRDSGPGISKQHVSFVFDRFYQVESEAGRIHEGTGIGLALAREMVELHGGSLHLDQNSSSGASFIVDLPIISHVVEDALLESGNGSPTMEADEWSVAAVDSVQDCNEKNTTCPSVLIVEDNDDVRAYIREHLEQNYTCYEAQNGLSGIDLARSIQPDLIISDVMMPEADGFELCTTLKNDPDVNHIPIILLTALASDASKLDGLETGADDYIVKPFNANQLLVRVENLIDIRQKLRDRYSKTVVAVEASQAGLPSVDKIFLEKLQRVTEEHIADSQFSVSWLADELALSSRQAQRKIKALTGLSAGGYIRCIRLQRAAYELENHVGNVSEVADHVGFKDTEYFSRLFRQVYGVPPSQYAAASNGSGG